MSLDLTPFVEIGDYKFCLFDHHKNLNLIWFKHILFQKKMDLEFDLIARREDLASAAWSVPLHYGMRGSFPCVANHKPVPVHSHPNLPSLFML